MNAKIEELKARHALELETLIKTEADHEKIRATLPLDNLPPIKKIHPHFAYGDYVVVFEPAEDMAQAIYCAEILNPVCTFRVKGSCTAVLPDPALDKYLGKHPTDTYESMGVYYYEISGVRGYPDEKTLHCHVVVGDLVLRIDIPVKHDPDTRRDYKITFNRRGVGRKEYCRLINYSGHFPHKITWRASQDQPNDYTLY